MQFLPIKKTLDENREFSENEYCRETLSLSVDYYQKIGYNPPWIGYFVAIEGQFIGTGGFKGKPVDRKVEIAYGVFEPFRKKGFGSEICRHLVKISLDTDPEIEITARTLPAKGFSTRILEKNGFSLLGTVEDPEDGEVWEWGYDNWSYI